MTTIMYRVKREFSEVTVRVSREQVAENRRKILEAAGRLFRARGFEAVTVAEVMQAAGLTHGGFYGHFRSKDDLIAQTLAHAILAGDDRQRSRAEFDLARYATGYLSPRHRDDLAGGCPTAALGADTIRQAPAARAAMTAGLRRRIELLSEAAPGASAAEKRRVAVGSWAAMVGAVILARLSDDPQLADELLEETRAWLDDKGATRTAGDG
jgi:TetR/AcrR family transcriptional regulator, transcriptional repressor for nem operon